MAEDARYRAKVWMEAYLTPANLTDDNGDNMSGITAFGWPPYPLQKIFNEMGVDFVISVGEPESTALLDFDQVPYGYEESTPIEIGCIDKPNITATKALWTVEAEIRRIAETYPTGSQRSLERIRDTDKMLGSMKLCGRLLMLNYVRDTT